MNDFRTADADDDFYAPMYARGMSGPLGKFSAEVKTLLDPPTFELWQGLCSEAGITSSELLREFLYLLLHGKTPGEMSAEDRRAVLTLGGRKDALLRLRNGSPLT